MSYWLFDVLALALPSAVLLWGARAPRRLWGAVAVLAAVAVGWTAPWDDYLVRSGVWSYDGDRVLARVGSVPIEEYAFVILLVVLVAAAGARTGRLPARAGTPVPSAGRCRVSGAASWCAVTALGAVLVVAGGPLRYLGLLLVWAGPPLAVQRAVAGDLLRSRLADRAVLALPVAGWLCVADRLALADGIWTITPATSTGVLLLGLPVEEALFFALTCLLVADGLVLATDDRALARARHLVRWRPAAAPATTRPSPPTSAATASARVRMSR